MTGGELAGYDDALAREIEARMEAATAVAGESSDGAGGLGVVVGSPGSAGEHTIEEVTSEEAVTGEERSEERTSEGEDNENQNREAEEGLVGVDSADVSPIEEP